MGILLKRFLVYVKSSQRTPPTENIAHYIKINASSARESAPISFMPIFCNKSRNLVIVSMSNKIWQAKISAIKLNSNSTINPIVRLIQLIPVLAAEKNPTDEYHIVFSPMSILGKNPYAEK